MAHQAGGRGVRARPIDIHKGLDIIRDESLLESIEGLPTIPSAGEAPAPEKVIYFSLPILISNIPFDKTLTYQPYYSYYAAKAQPGRHPWSPERNPHSRCHKSRDVLARLPPHLPRTQHIHTKQRRYQLRRPYLCGVRLRF